MNHLAEIIIVDDHVMFREGLKLLIETEGMGKVIAEADNGMMFLNLLEKHHPNLVLMDIEMPVMGGLEAIVKSLLIRPDLKILVLSMLCVNKNYIDIINAGAMGFILKSSGKHELKKAIKTLIDGESYFSNELLRKIIHNIRKQPLIPEFSGINGINITDRELEVLQYLSKGLSANEIAVKLFRSVKTIETHRSKLLEKTNSKNTINLVLYALKNKLIAIS